MRPATSGTSGPIVTKPISCSWQKRSTCIYDNADTCGDGCDHVIYDSRTYCVMVADIQPWDALHFILR